MTDPRQRPFEPNEEEFLRRHVKAELRKRMRAIRKALPQTARDERSEKIAEAVSALEPFVRARTVASFLPMKTEVDVTRISTRARSSGKRVVVPRVDTATDTLVFHDYDEHDATEESAFGVTEPLVSAPRIAATELDLVLVPALAVDNRGHRVGYGKGYYDRFLPTAPQATAIVVAFDFQLIAEVPASSDDSPAQLVVTDARVLVANRAV